LAKRFWGERKFAEVRCYEERLNEPLHWKEPQRVFVNSMSDLFHPDVHDGFIYGAFMRMAKATQHTYIILTKRPQRMAQWFAKNESFWDLPNVWIGVSVENQQAADERIPILILIPAVVRFVSCEPLLGPVDLALSGTIPYSSPYSTFGNELDWVIVGGESGAHARPMHPDWARSLRDQCQEANVPFFFKQWGEWQLTDEREEMKQDGNERLTSIDVPGAIGYNKAWFRRVGKKNAGRLLDGRTWDEYPQEVER
jgi:protein gp37